MLWCKNEKNGWKNGKYSWVSEYTDHTRRGCLIEPETAENDLHSSSHASLHQGNRKIL
jgi:hypothetical protein